jgi:hypothetical protein
MSGTFPLRKLGVVHAGIFGLLVRSILVILGVDGLGVAATLTTSPRHLSDTINCPLLALSF